MKSFFRYISPLFLTACLLISTEVFSKEQNIFAIMKDSSISLEKRYDLVIKEGVYRLKQGNIELADSIYQAAYQLGMAKKAGFSYNWGITKIELFKKERELNPNQFNSKNRELALRYFNNSLISENKEYRETSIHYIKYLAQTLYNDAIVILGLDSEFKNDDLIVKAKKYFQQYLFNMQGAYPFEDYTDEKSLFLLAFGDKYAKLWENTKKDKYFELALENYQAVLEIDPNNSDAQVSIPTLKGKYGEMLLLQEKKLLQEESRRLDSSLAKLDSLGNEYKVEKQRLDLTKQKLRRNKEKVDSILASKESLNAEIDHQKQKLKRSELAILENHDILVESRLKLNAYKDNLNSTLSHLENQKLINISIIIIACIITLLLILAIRNFLKLKAKSRIIRNKSREIGIQHDLLSEKSKEISDSIDYAKRIQNAILPPMKLVKSSFPDSFVLYQPKDVISGDFYWLMEKANDGAKLFAAADCTGHGVPGAMVSVICNSALNRSVKEFGLSEPGDILTKTRELVIEEFEKSDEDVRDGMDIAMISIQEKETKPKSKKAFELKYAGANNPIWLIRHGISEIEEIKGHKQGIGSVENPKPYPTHTIEINEGDSVYLFSDGYADQFGGERGKKYKTLNFKEFLLSIQYHNMEEQGKLLRQEFETWKGDHEQIDDICVLGFRPE